MCIKYAILRLNNEKFSGEGAQPLARTPPLSARLQLLNPRRLDAPPNKNPAYATEQAMQCLHSSYI